MSDPGGLGPYPPAEIWAFPPPPVSRSWLVVAIVTSVLAVAAFGGSIGYLVSVSGHDVPGFINDEKVIDVAGRECELMTSTVEGLRIGGTPDQQASVLADQNKAVRTMINRVRDRLDPQVRKDDRPLDAWLADWEILVTGRETYVSRLLDGEDIDFRVPITPEGDPITERMNLAGQDVCSVPRILLKPRSADTRDI